MVNTNVYYMELAIEEAVKAYNKNEVPIGCVIVYKDKVIATGYNRKSIDNVATYHAEVLAIEDACKYLGTWYLDECTLYTTVEPCMMCTGAIIQSRVKKVVYGCKNEAFGYLSRVDTRIEIESGVLEDKCKNILSGFFKQIREGNDNIESK